MARARASPTPSTPTRSEMLARMIFGSRPNRSITWSAIVSGRRGIRFEQAVPARLHRRVEIHLRREPQQRRHDAQVEDVLVGEVGELVDHDFERPVRRLEEVVAPDEPPVVLDAAGQLLELELDQSTVVTELHDVTLDLVGDPPDHLGPLEHRRDVAERHEILHLEGRQRPGDPVEARFVPTEDLERLIGARPAPAGSRPSVRLWPR